MIELKFVITAGEDVLGIHKTVAVQEPTDIEQLVLDGLEQLFSLYVAGVGLTKETQDEPQR